VTVDPGGAAIGSFYDHVRTLQGVDKQVRDVLRDAAKQANSEILQLGGTNAGEAVRRRQYQIIRSSIQRMEADSWSDLQAVIQGNASSVLGDATNAAIGLAEYVSAPLSQEFAVTIQAAAETSAERVAARIAGRVDLSERVYKNQMVATGQIDKIVNQGIALNQSAREIAKRVFQFVNPGTPGGQSYAAMRLARTELNNAFHTASVRNYGSQPWVDAVKWEISGSHPRSDICNEYAEIDNGKGSGIYQPRMVPAKPHPHCLCHILPVTVSPEEFVDQLVNGKYDKWLEENGQEGFGHRDPEMLFRPRDLAITKEQIIEAREAGKSWAKIADDYGLGSPGSARSAWTRLTGTPHNTAPSGRAVTSAIKNTPAKAPVLKPTVIAEPKPVVVPKPPSIAPIRPNTTIRSVETLRDAKGKLTTKSILTEKYPLAEKLPKNRPPVTTTALTRGEQARIERIVNKFTDRFPAVRVAKVRVTDELPSGAYAAYEVPTKVVKVRAKDLLNLNKTNKALADEYRRGWGLGKNFDDVIHHELGHAMDYTARQSPGYGRALSDVIEKHFPDLSYEEFTQVKYSGYKGHEMSWDLKDKLAKKTSKYGATEIDEMVAEAFADVMASGEMAKPLSKDLVRMVEEYATKAVLQ
jgi:hypothetical protein